MTKQNSTSSGIGFFGLLTIVFIVLKLTNVIAWSWWWVLAPLWGPILAILFGATLYVIIVLHNKSKRRKQK